MFCQSLSNPAIFSIVSPDDHNKIVPSYIVGVKKIRHYTQQAQTTSENDKLIFGTKLGEEILLILLYQCEIDILQHMDEVQTY